MAEQQYVPGDLVVFDMAWAYKAQALSVGPEAAEGWVEIQPGEPGLVVTIVPGSPKPLIVMFGLHGVLVRLTAAAVRRAKTSRRPPPPPVTAS